MGLRTLAALLYGSLSRTPVWIWWGGTLRTEQHLGRGKRLLRKVIARWAKHWISYGRTSTEYLLSLGIDRGRILQIQNCVDESWYRSIETHRLDIEPRPVLLHVGQMIPRKGISEFLRAAAHVQEEGLDFSIVLVGSGPDREQLERLVEQLHLRNVRFYGAQPPHAVASFYRSAEVLVFPTMEDVWGLVANEGVLSGMRVLCSKHAGCAPELFDQEATFDPENEAEFVVALRRAVTGQLPQPDPTRLLPARQVAQMIISEIYSSLKAPAAGWQPRPDPQM
jgi:glycosyltransferase involved in cell wall biosynthesis